MQQEPPACIDFALLHDNDFMERRAPANAKVKKWDGAARASSSWDSLRRDPELWYRGGNCFVHLYGKGQSQRGPAFKVPFASLLSAYCHPLLQRCISRDRLEVAGLGLDEFDDLELWNEQNPTRRVDLFVPAPLSADKDDAFRYHITTRNFFAWIFRRSVVGEHLGAALSDLLDSMAEFRTDDCDNVADLLDYMDEEGYLGVDSHPDHAVAVLRLAEAHQIRDAYIHAFTHCVGMSEHLESAVEYEQVTVASKRLIRKSRLEMDVRLGKAGKTLQTFLEDDLGEPTVMLAPGARAHLDRFRSFLMSFYSSRLGYYPPPTIDSRHTMFERQIYQSMHEDFRALYEFLVDESATAGDRVPSDGGISVIQCVLAFDSRRRYLTLDHPFPLLPEANGFSGGKRQTWLSRGDKLSPDQRLVAHAALVRSSNMDPRVLENGLVRAYRKFEEHMVAPSTRVDRNEKISLVDARKVRWLMVYSVYQVLRQCVRVAPEVSDTDVDYNLCVSVDDLPPWEANGDSPASTQGAWDKEAEEAMFSPLMDFSMDIEDEPDHQILVRTVVQQSVQPGHGPPSSSWTLSSSGQPSGGRSKSIKSASRKFHRSMSLFNRRTAPAGTEPLTAPARRNSMYQEIVVRGYGNGTNPMYKDLPPPPPPKIDTAIAAAYCPPTTIVRSHSRSSYSSSVYTDDAGDASSRLSTTDTAESSLPSDSPRSSKSAPASAGICPPILSPIPVRSRRREVESMCDSDDFSSISEKPSSPDYARCYEDLVQEERDRVELCPAPLQIRKTASTTGRRRTSFSNTPPEAYPVQGPAAALPKFEKEVIRGRRRGRHF